MIRVLRINKYFRFFSNPEFVGLVFFLIILAFQTTTLKFLWNLEKFSGFVNLLFLFFNLVVGIISILTCRYSKQTWIFFLLPVILVLLFQFFNIARNVISDFKLAGYFGLLLPWLVLINVPFLLKNRALNIEKLWKYFYLFMTFTIFFSLIEYFLVITGSYQPRIIVTPYGSFLAGRLTIFHMLNDGMAHERFYACFGEPGDLAMALIPVILYSLLRKKYFSLVLFLTALYFTKSLGGAIAVIFLLIMVPLYLVKGKAVIFGFLISFLALLVSFFVIGDYMKNEFENKGDSRVAREESVSRTLSLMSSASFVYPFGLKLEETTEKMEKNPYYFGSNFSVGTAFVLGGTFAVLGYVLYISLSVFTSIYAVFHKNRSELESMVYCLIVVLTPFIFQRVSIYDSAIYNLLFAPVILRAIDKRYLTVL